MRQLLGYQRLETPDALPLINELYKQVWSTFQNHFIPTFKLLDKHKIRSRYVRLFEEPKTPYQRLLDSPHILPSKKQSLAAFHDALNPYTLKKQRENLLKLIFNLNYRASADIRSA